MRLILKAKKAFYFHEEAIYVKLRYSGSESRLKVVNKCFSTQMLIFSLPNVVAIFFIPWNDKRKHTIRERFIKVHLIPPLLYKLHESTIG